MSSMDGISLWNRLGSSEQLVKSEIGSSITVGANEEYAQGFFAMGRDYGIGSGNYDFMPNFYVGNQFTLEFWFTPEFDSTDTTMSDNQLCFFSDDNLVSYERLRFVFIPADESPAKTFLIGSGNASNTGFQRMYFNINQDWSAGDNVHIALVIDADATYKVRLFQDNVELANTTTGGAAYTVANTTALLTDFTISNAYLGNLFSTERECGGVIENIKKYDVVKTDFSDRLIQGFGGQKMRSS